MGLDGEDEEIVIGVDSGEGSERVRQAWQRW